ncbi:hypothetical protein Cs308_0093 [Candidatus Chlamydia sanziniae]|uniref:Uncharacterized protein n=1 Tax=Candidatus Chlamydia sanziniae TaxID=1806891 RepID=A0A1A9HW48_9CHLA|nr:hypothetical protein Cs308_0093 [Candidatus Chlamydia sanziniae]
MPRHFKISTFFSLTKIPLNEEKLVIFFKKTFIFSYSGGFSDKPSTTKE